MSLGQRVYQVMRWDPDQNRFIPLRQQVSDLGLALQWAAENRLLDAASRFAVFDGGGQMIEDESGRLHTSLPDAETS